MPVPTAAKLYAQVKSLAKQKFKRWPSAYGSAWLTKEYKRRGGKYSSATKSSGVGRWMKEEWIQVSPYLKNGARIPCGAKNRSNTKACRPYKRVSPKTPMTIQELVKRHGKSKLKKMSRSKERDMKRRMNWKGKS